MDSTKTISYRRWRKRLLDKGLLSIELAVDESYKAPPAFKVLPRDEAIYRDQGEMDLKMNAFNKRDAEMQAQRLMKELEREYQKKDCFRKDKVAELKQLIKSGNYQVSGKDVVDKWFPEDSATESV